jgi:hypothetical protein
MQKSLGAWLLRGMVASSPKSQRMDVRLTGNKSSYEPEPNAISGAQKSDRPRTATSMLRSPEPGTRAIKSSDLAMSIST